MATKISENKTQSLNSQVVKLHSKWISTSQPLRWNFGLFFGRGGTLKIQRGHTERFWWSWRPWTPKSCQVSFSKWSGPSTRASGGWPPLVTASPEVVSHLARDYWLSWAPTPLPIAETYNQTQVQTGPEELGRNCYLWGDATHAKRIAWFFFPIYKYRHISLYREIWRIYVQMELKGIRAWAVSAGLSRSYWNGLTKQRSWTCVLALMASSSSKSLLGWLTEPQDGLH